MEKLQFPDLEIVPFIQKVFLLSGFRKLLAYLLYVLFLLYFSLPGLQVPLFEYITVRHSSLMDQRILESYLLQIPSQSIISIDHVSPVLLKSIISMEDGTFFDHHGVNWTELKKSMQVNERKKKKARGGSTITMQLAKNMFFSTDKSYIRKAKEIILTFRLEKEISKRAILHQYVNIIEWGEGIYGIGAASDLYFSKNAENLSVNEANRLAAVIPAPLKFKPNQNNKYVLRRSSIIKNRFSGISIKQP